MFRKRSFWVRFVICLSAALCCAFLAEAAAAEETSVGAFGIPTAVLSEFTGKRIGLQAASTQEAKAPELFGDFEMSYYNTLQDVVLALQNGKLDAFFADDIPLIYAAGLTEELTVLEAGGEGIECASVFQKTEKGELLRSQYNAFLAECREDGRLDAMTDKWVNGPEEVRVMENDELPDINGTLIIAAEVGYTPFEYMKDGKLVGFEVELLREFCRAYGYRPDFCNTSFDALIMGVYTGKFDIAASAMTITEERKQTVSFGDPFVITHNGLLVRKDGGWTGTAGMADKDSAPAEKESFLQSVAKGIRRTFIEERRWTLFVSGMSVTLLITVLSVLLGSVLGFVLYLLCRNGNRLANALVGASKWLITGMPLVVFLMILFYIVFAKSTLSGTAVAVAGFTIVFGFTMFDLMKSGEGAVDIGQKEAAYALGYSDMDAFLRIILPQAARHFMPAYLSEVVSLIKATAVVGYITVMDVTKIGDIVRGRTYDAVYPLLAVVIAYFLLSALCRAALRIVMKKIDTKSRPKVRIMKGVEIR